MGSDCLPYRLRRGDVAKLGEPFRFGEDTALIEMPISWSLDDYPHFEFVRTAAASARCDGELDGRVPLHEKECRMGCANLHYAPVRYRAGYRMLALEDLVDKLGNEGGALFVTMEVAACEAQHETRQNLANF